MDYYYCYYCYDFYYCDYYYHRYHCYALGTFTVVMIGGTSSMVMVTVSDTESVPSLTVTMTVYVPLSLYVCMTLVAEPVLVKPSPNTHVMVMVLRSGVYESVTVTLNVSSSPCGGRSCCG